jgi:hypothetical protein
VMNIAAASRPTDVAQRGLTVDSLAENRM